MRPGRNAFYYYPSVISAQCSLSIVLFSEGSEFFICSSYHFYFSSWKWCQRKQNHEFNPIPNKSFIFIRNCSVLQVKALIVKSMQHICKNICKAMPQLSTKPYTLSVQGFRWPKKYPLLIQPFSVCCDWKKSVFEDQSFLLIFSCSTLALCAYILPCMTQYDSFSHFHFTYPMIFFNHNNT